MQIVREDEEQLLKDILSYLRLKYPEKAAAVEERFVSLNALGETVSLFPVIRDTDVLEGSLWERDTIIDSFGNFSPASRLIHTPTRIMVFRAFLVAKLHTFTLLFDMAKEEASYENALRTMLFSIISLLMAEDVYLSCLHDPLFPRKEKNLLFEGLMNLWNYGREPGENQYLLELKALWTARDNAPPCFGTMGGLSELVRLFIDLDSVWQDFIITILAEDGSRWALEEFLFGLSYEEIIDVRSRLRRFGINTVNYDEVRSYLGNRPSYTMVDVSNPQAVYDFYLERRDMAFFRKRIGAPGPKKTVEELYLQFRTGRA